MSTITTRLSRLEATSPDRRSIYELTDRELIVAMGLPADTPMPAVVAHIEATYGARRIAGTPGLPQGVPDAA